jgi:aldose 1-epimerase
LITLTAAHLTVDLLPEIGGSVASFRWHRTEGAIDLLRRMSDEACLKRDPAGAAMFPMVPQANRIAHNKFRFGVRTHRVRPNVPGEPWSLHGTGWQSAWTVSSGDASSAQLTLEYIEPGEPYSYWASQEFMLTPAGLTVTMGVTNRGATAMPFGFGLHPWWMHEPDATLKFRSTHFWLEGPGYLATDRITLPPELDFSQPKALPRRWRNNCYSGWDGRAELCFPRSRFGLRIEADSTFRHLMLYCDPDKRIFCLEPQTHATGALNRLGDEGEDDLGLIVLEPGESARGAVSFVPFDIGHSN